MPILLTTSITFPATLGNPAEVYTQAKIIGFEAIVEPSDDAGLTIRVQFGNTVDNAWIPGKLDVVYVTVCNVPAEHGEVAGEYVETKAAVLVYSNWVGTVKAQTTTELMFDEVAAALYQYLMANEEGYAGVVV